MNRLQDLESVVDEKPMTIRERVAVLTEAGMSDPREMAEIINADIPDCDLRMAAREMLPGHIRVCFHSLKFSHREEPAKRNTNTHAGLAGPSRWDSIAAALRKPVCPGGTWKAFGDCARDDILLLASERREKAAQCAAVAEAYEELERRMAERSVSFVRDMPIEEIPEVLR